MNVFVALRYPFTIENYLVLFDVLLFILFFSVDLNLLYSSNGRSALLKTTNAFTTLPSLQSPAYRFINFSPTISSYNMR